MTGHARRPRRGAAIGRTIAAAAIGVAGLLGGIAASAYCRTTTCPTCPRGADSCTIGGVPLAWPGQCVSYSMNAETPPDIPFDRAKQLMDVAFSTWQSVACDDQGRPPSIRVADVFGKVDCAEKQHNAVQGNANIIFFRAADWPYADAGSVLARTTVTYDDSGQIYDADMEINATQPLGIEIDASVPKAHYDLQSIMIHEAGHFLGLDHTTADAFAVMKIDLGPQALRRDLRPDDIAGICSIYPPERPVPACNFAPRNGFSPSCELQPTGGGSCSIGRAPRGRPLAMLVFAGAAALMAAMRRARQKPTTASSATRVY